MEDDCVAKNVCISRSSRFRSVNVHLPLRGFGGLTNLPYFNATVFPVCALSLAASRISMAT